MQYHRIAPGAGFVARCARALLAVEGGPDLTAWHVVVPNILIAPPFKRALVRGAGRSLLLPAVETLQVHLAPWAAEFTPVSEQRRHFALYRQLRARHWFDQGNLWSLCAEFVALFDELTTHGARLAEDEAALSAQLASAYAARDDASLRFEASVVHQLWYAEAQGAPSLTAARLLGAAAWTRTAPSPMLVIAEGPLPAPWQAWLAEHAERAPVVLCEADWHAADDPALIFLDLAWPADEGAPLKDRAAAPDDALPLDERVVLLYAESLEEEAHAVAEAVRRALLEGAASIALVAVDRLVARRARALLERDDILVEDESGWKLSTTRAAALVDAVLEVLARDGYHRDVLDLCKSPFVFGDITADTRQQAVLMLERTVREANLASGLDALARLVAKHAGAAALAARLLAARQALPMTKAPPQRWLMRLRAVFDALGAMVPLQADAAGEVLLEWLDGCIDDLHDEDCALDFDEWRAWLDGRLDEALFRDRSIRSPVVMTHLPACRLRGFDVAIVIGADAEQLRAAETRPVFVHEGARQDLGLPGPGASRERLRADVAGLIAASGRAVFTWQQLKGGEPCQIAADLELLDLAHVLRFGRTLKRRAAPVPMPEVKPLGQPVPAPAVPLAMRPHRITAYGYQSLLDCPYQYFARFVLGLDAAAEVREALEKRDYGQMVHAILERFHRQYPLVSEGDAAQMLAALEAISDDEFRKAIAANYLETAWAVRWRKQLPNYLDWQRAREAEGWRYVAGEHALQRALPLADGGSLNLTGRLDRVDEAGSGAVAVLDYKTRDRTALRKQVKDPEDVQLAVYGALAGEAVREAAYVSLDGERIETVSLDAPRTIVEAHVTHLIGLFEHIGAGAPMVANGTGMVCDYCAVRGLCRKDYHQPVDDD